MHVLYVIDSLAPAGAERSLVDLIPELVDRGVVLTVAVLHDRPGLAEEAVAGGATVVSIAGPGGRTRWVLRLVRLVRRIRPDLIHTTLFDADVVGRATSFVTGVPVVTTLVSTHYGPDHVEQPGLSRRRVRAAQMVDALTARRVRRFHAVSRTVAEVMARRLRLDASKVEVFPRGRATRRLGALSPDRRAAVRSTLGFGPEDGVVLTVARHEYAKGLDVLIEAMATVRSALPGARAVIAGAAGQQTGLLRALVDRLELGRHVELLGFRDDIGDLLAACDLLVLPSRREGMPGALLEAMAVGRAVVATDLPTVRELVDSSMAWLVPPADAASLASAITTALTHAEEAGRRAERSRRRFVERFSIERAADDMASFYGRALGLAG
jgi:glycosyltransferase involved in cell wall biosynthesis